MAAAVLTALQASMPDAAAVVHCCEQLAALGADCTQHFRAPAPLQLLEEALSLHRARADVVDAACRLLGVVSADGQVQTAATSLRVFLLVLKDAALQHAGTAGAAAAGAASAACLAASRVVASSKAVSGDGELAGSLVAAAAALVLQHSAHAEACHSATELLYAVASTEAFVGFLSDDAMECYARLWEVLPQHADHEAAVTSVLKLLSS
jgi:hypothetical protein